MLTKNLLLVLATLVSCGASAVEPVSTSRQDAVDGVVLRRYFEKYARVRLVERPKDFVQYFVLPNSGDVATIEMSVVFQEELGLNPEQVLSGHLAVESYAAMEAEKRLNQLLRIVLDDQSEATQRAYLQSTSFIDLIERQVIDLLKKPILSQEERLLELEILGRMLDRANKDEKDHFRVMSLISSFKANDIMGNSKKLRDIFLDESNKLAKARKFGFRDRWALAGAFKNGLKVAEEYYSEGLMEAYVKAKNDLKHQAN
ncbi:hypothetical protein GW915_03805 [bacterium]|nr:hypothetical protein [bacterium]